MAIAYEPGKWEPKRGSSVVIRVVDHSTSTLEPRIVYELSCYYCDWTHVADTIEEATRFKKYHQRIIHDE